jgi:hypothetical protein
LVRQLRVLYRYQLSTALRAREWGSRSIFHSRTL